VFSRLVTMHQRDGQTDGRTDRHPPTASTALTLSVAWKKVAGTKYKLNNEVYSHKSSTCRSIKGNKTTEKTDRTETYFTQNYARNC